MPFQFSPAAAAALLSLLPAALAGTFHMIPYSDAGCQNAINATYTSSPDPSDYFYFDIGTGVSNPLTSTTYFQNLQFPGASFSTGSSAYNVWWKAQISDENCRIALMTDYSQFHYDQLGGPIQTYGNVVINAGDDGACYYSAVPAGSEISGTFCCGVGDCALIAAGNDALLLKRDVELGPEEAEAAVQPLAKKQEERSAEPEANARSFEGSPAARARALVARGSCVATVTDGPFPAAGYQTLVANTQTCTTGSCSFIVNHGISLSTTMTSTSDQTITNSVGVSVSTTAGENLLIEQASVTVGVSYDFAIAIGKSTSEAVMNGTSVTVTNSLGQALGTTAFATFTPTYNCYSATVDCGHGVSDPMEFCNPALSADGTTALGDYNVVYIG